MASKKEDPKKSADISSNHHSKNITPPIIIKNVAKKSNNNNLVRVSNFGTVSPVCSIEGYRLFTIPSILNTIDAEGFFLTLLA